MSSYVQPSTLPSETEKERIEFLRSLTQPHIESFNFAVMTGLPLLPSHISPVAVSKPDTELPDSTQLLFSISDVKLARPKMDPKRADSAPMLPSHARQLRMTYRASLSVEITVATYDAQSNSYSPLEVFQRKLGEAPVMVGSTACNLFGKSPKELIQAGEEEYECGGYFIGNGVEKVVRMVVVPRRHYPMAIKRAANANRGDLYSEYSVGIRCVRQDQSSITNHLHYLTSGGASLRFTIKRQEFFLPVVLVIRALSSEFLSDRDIYEMIVQGDEDDHYLSDRALAMIKDASDITASLWQKKPTSGGQIETELVKCLPRSAILDFIGSQFGILLSTLPKTSDRDIGKLLLEKFVLVHLSRLPGQEESEIMNKAKIDLLILMIRKLVFFRKGDIVEDNPDSLMNQEVLLPGHLYLIYMKEKLEDYLQVIAATYRKGFASEKTRAKLMANMLDPGTIPGMLGKCNVDIGMRLEYFVATGNLQTQTGLDLLQTSGYSVVAERINFMRFISHFRCLHRGQFFTAVKTTSVRKLLPEAWGFVCPVHTPDGAPCGLLNHITASANITQTSGASRFGLTKTCTELGALPPSSLSRTSNLIGKAMIPILADGFVAGFIQLKDGPQFVKALRNMKTTQANGIPDDAEIALVTPRAGLSLLPGVYIFSTPARLVRPVRWLDQPDKKPCIEKIGTFEQVYMRVRLAEADGSPEAQDEEISKDPFPPSHAELANTGILSVLASLTPFSDMNQSPRNMYQCQMSKQAMGTPCHYFRQRPESKNYRLLTPQVPVTRNKIMQDPGGFDTFPNGFNAIVAVISYTGYDMEDAMILNKSAVDRGFADGYVYTSDLVDLDNVPGAKKRVFGSSKEYESLDRDGLPRVGSRLVKGDPLYSTRDRSETVPQDILKNYKTADQASVEHVAVLAGPKSSRLHGCRRASITLRQRRSPVIGDKFASRAGQKGTVASLWPTADMPYTERGLIPDILFNPNGFPSRMTIGMMIESMTGKSSCVHGLFQDSTPFRFDEQYRAVDYFGEQLAKAGYNFYGSETMYSGYTGEPFEVDIFMGVINYQRLRHMVSDKFQVRSTGPVNPLTRQPIKGRKLGGAIRFGEMERDAMLGHGASHLLHDRLAVASDLHVVHICRRCGSLLTLIKRSAGVVCLMCDAQPSSTEVVNSGSGVARVLMPFVFKCLVNELAAMNIKVVLGST